MANLKDLKEMAKNGDLSKKLMEDEGFKSELKKILKEESGLEITDDQIPEVIKSIEKSIKGESVLDETELDAVSGGGFASKAIKGVLTTTGFLVGSAGGLSAGASLGTPKRLFDAAVRGDKTGYKDMSDEEMVAALSSDVTKSGLSATGGLAVGATAGTYGGYKLASLICKKFNIK